jgi:hypothetical protein
MTINRRNILAVLGLSAAGVSTEALAVEDDNMYPMYCPAMTKRSVEQQHKIAQALENLAHSIRNGEAVAIKLLTTSETEGDDFLKHDVTVSVELPAMPMEVRISKESQKADELHRKAIQELEDARAEAKKIKDKAYYDVLKEQNAEWSRRNVGPTPLSEKV